MILSAITLASNRSGRSTDLVGYTALTAKMDLSIDTYEFGDVPVTRVPMPRVCRFV